jgi:hypothetical protein
MQKYQTPNTLILSSPSERPRATLADVSILVGHWRGEFLGAMAEEVWLPSAGGSMLGVFRLYRDDQVLFYEIMIAAEDEGSVSLKLKHFDSNLTGWEEKDGMVTFQLVKANEDSIWFEGLTYHKQEEDTLQGYIAIRQKDGNITENSFTLYRVRAP